MVVTRDTQMKDVTSTRWCLHSPCGQQGPFLSAICDCSLGVRDGSLWVILHLHQDSRRPSSPGGKVEFGPTLFHSQEALLLSSLGILGKFLISMPQLPHHKTELMTELPHRVEMRTEWVNTCNALNTVSDTHQALDKHSLLLSLQLAAHINKSHCQA